MTEAVEIWRKACIAYGGASIEGGEGEMLAARVIAEALTERASMAAEIERLRVANGILEDGLQEVGDDYPGSSCQKWCQHQINMARAALEARS